MGFFQFVKTPDINRGIADCRNTEGAVLLDVRTPQEYREGHIPGSINIPLQQLDKAIDAYENKAVPLFVYCHSGACSYIASRILEGNGFTAYNFSGGFRFYDAVVNDRALIESAYSCGMDQ